MVVVVGIFDTLVADEVVVEQVCNILQVVIEELVVLVLDSKKSLVPFGLVALVVAFGLVSHE